MLQEAYPAWPALRPIARPARLADIPSLLDLAQEGIDQCLVPDTAIDRDWLTNAWESVIANPDKTWNRVIEFEGKLVGYTHGYAAPQWHTPRLMAYLATLYIRPEYRKISLFGELIEGFTNWWREIGAEAGWAALTNGIQGPAWDRLWRRYGYHYTGTMYERIA